MAFLARGIAMLADGRVAIRQRDLDFVRALCGHQHALGCAHPTGDGSCWIMIADDREHGFRQIDVLTHELMHCGGWQHPDGAAFNFTRR